MNTSVLTADRATHLKIVVTSLLAGTLVVLISLFAHGTADPITIRNVAKTSTIGAPFASVLPVSEVGHFSPPEPRSATAPAGVQGVLFSPIIPAGVIGVLG